MGAAKQIVHGKKIQCLTPILWVVLGGAMLAAERPHWDRVQHFVFVLLPEAGFDQYFGGFEDSEGQPGQWGPKEVPNLWAYAELYTLQDHFFASPEPATMMRQLAGRVSWREYAGDLGEFAADCKRDTLPAVSFLAPADGDMAYVTRVVNAVAGSPAWRRSAVFVSWARAGAAPDHMIPPPGFGKRVPSLVISPWTRVAYNDHRVYTHASWVRTVENRFGLGHGEDAVADMYDPFDFAQQPREPVLMDPAGVGTYPVTGQGQVFPASGWLDSVHRSHGTWTVAPGAMVIGYGDRFVEAGEEAVVWVTDSSGVRRRATVQYAGVSQVNYVVPEGTTTGLAQVRIDTARQRYDGFLLVERVSPGLFTATQKGQGPADGESETGSTFACVEARCFHVPLQGRRVALRGTGLRLAGTVRAWVEGREASVVRYEKDADVEGLDWVEMELPENLNGSALVMVEADGVLSNAVQLLLGAGLW